MKLTKEQIKIVNLVGQNKNVMIEAVAGSGKTSTSLAIAKAYPNKKILLLTFNKLLADENNTKIKTANLTDIIETFTFHAFFGKYFAERCHTDVHLFNLNRINMNAFQSNNIKNYDVIIIDEAQDLSFIIYQILAKIIVKSYHHASLVVLGDSKQSIYQFFNSSHFFLTKANKAFNLNDKKWVKAKLSISFRVPQVVCNFINDCYYSTSAPFITGYDKSKQDNTMFKYLVANSFDAEALYNKLEPIIKQYTNQDIFILSNSVKNTNFGSRDNPIANFKNILVNRDANNLIYSSSTDEKTNRDKITQNKITFSSIHQAKGREKKLVIVFNFDNNFFKIKKEQSNLKIPPNDYYVALTRAKEKLIVIEHYNAGTFTFLNKATLNKYEEVIMPRKQPKIEKVPLAEVEVCYVTSLLQYIDFELILDDFIKVRKNLIVSKVPISDELKNAQILHEFKSTNKVNYYENVATLIGEFLPIYYQYSKITRRQTKKLLQNALIKLEEFTTEKQPYKIIKQYESDLKTMLIKPKLSYEDLMRYVLIKKTIDENNIVNLNQIKEFSWLNQPLLNESKKIFDSILSNKLDFEFPVATEFKVPHKKNPVLISGSIDCIDHQTKTIWEFKFVNDLKDEHLLQLILYKWLINKSKYSKLKNYKYKLFNLKSGEIWTLKISDTRLSKIALNLFNNRYLSGKNLITEELFKKRIAKILKLVKKIRSL